MVLNDYSLIVAALGICGWWPLIGFVWWGVCGCACLLVWWWISVVLVLVVWFWVYGLGFVIG